MHTEYRAVIHIGEPAKAGPLTQEWVSSQSFDTAAAAWQALGDEWVNLEDIADVDNDLERDHVEKFLDRDEPGDLCLNDPGHDQNDDMAPCRTYSVVVTN